MDSRERRWQERRTWERLIDPEVRAEREKREDIALLVRKRAVNDPLCRMLM